MEVKKSKEASLENEKSIWVQVGLVMILSIMLIALEWTTTDVSIDLTLVENDLVVEEDVIPITRHEESKPPPPPQPVVTDVLTIVEDDVELDDALEIFDTEMDDNRVFDMTISTIEVEEEERHDTEIFTIVEEMPEFPGGTEALMKYINSSIKYPPIAQENGISGKVILQFVINQNGEVTNITVARGVDPSLDREAIRVVQAMPKWSPGKQRNRPVRVAYTLPINFQLQ